MTLYLRILKYLWPYKVTILVTWLISLLVLALQGISVWIGAEFIEKILTGQTGQGPDPSVVAGFMTRLAGMVLEQSTPFKSLVAAVVALLIAALLTTCFRVSKTYLFARINQAILTRIRSELFGSMTRLDLSFSRTYRPGALASIFIRDTEQLEMAIIDAADRIFMQPIRLIMAATLMLCLSVKLTLITFSFLLISSLTVHLAGDKIERLTEVILEKAAHLQGVLTEYLSAVVVSRSLGREGHEQSRFVQACRSLANTAVKQNVLRALVPQMVNNLFILSGGILMLIGGYSVLVTQTISGGTLIKLVLLLPVATYPIESLATLYLSIRASLASAKRVFGLMDESTGLNDAAKGSRPARPLKTAMALSNVSYGVNGHSILKEISITFPRGSRTVIFGPSGAGKTTILSLIAKFAVPSQGAIRVDDVDLNDIDGTSWRKQLGIVIQEPVLLNDTVRENLRYAKPTVDDASIRRVLQYCQLWNESGCVFKEGLDTQVGNRGELVSGGERQRLTIARSILNDPDIILMDEPTAMVDVDSKKKIRDAIYAVSKERTLVLVTHDPLLGEIADRQFRIESGQLIEM